MGGISQCPECGDLYYGDERDDWQTCRCSPPTPPEEVAKLRHEHEMQEAIDDLREAWVSQDWSLVRDVANSIERSLVEEWRTR